MRRTLAPDVAPPREAVAALVLLAAAHGAFAADCAAGPGVQRLSEGPVALLWHTEPAAPAVGQAFALHVELCPAAARLLRVDATMPEHRHGMNYRPSLHALAPGRWRADGLLWHMSGRWELRLDVALGEARQVLRQSVVLP
jgi:hypothetical protein